MWFCYGSANGIIDFLGEKDKKDLASESTNDSKFQTEEMSNSSISSKTYNVRGHDTGSYFYV